MSRSGYCDYDVDTWDIIRWRGAVKSAMRGKRGQQFFRDLISALDALPEKRLIGNHIEQEGSYCALGALGRARGIDTSSIDPENAEAAAGTFGIAEALARETVYQNDEYFMPETPEGRWRRMRAWAEGHLKKEPSHD